MRNKQAFLKACEEAFDSGVGQNDRKTERFEFRLTPAQKQWIEENGGAKTLSLFIDAAMKAEKGNGK